MAYADHDLYKLTLHRHPLRHIEPVYFKTWAALCDSLKLSFSRDVHGVPSPVKKALSVGEKTNVVQGLNGCVGEAERVLIRVQEGLTAV